MKNKTLITALSLFALTSCLSDGNETIILEAANAVTPPASEYDDSKAQANPEIGIPNIVLPNPNIAIVDIEGIEFAQLEMTGIWDDTNNQWVRLYGTNKKNQNVWISVDGQPKYLTVRNLIDDSEDFTIADDVVFLIDNSTSMDEEADAVANSINSWASKLKKQGIDLQVGCVGYGGDAHAIDGALNLTSPSAMAKYLDHGVGTERTMHFGGDDADMLLRSAIGSDKYENGPFNECGVLALRFAHDNFAFRNNANRIYINFTDEPNQPNGISAWSVDYLNPEHSLWDTSFGTIHTVFSGEGRDFDTLLYAEKPWLMSTYTGGSVLFTDGAFTGLSLDDLPVTGAMQNAYVLRFGNVAPYIDGKPHKVRITVLANDGAVRADKEYLMTFTR